MKTEIKKITYAGMCLALALVLPFLTGQIPEIGSMLCPMHIPVLLCGFICGPRYAFEIGFIAPLLRNVIFGMPPAAAVPAMAFEMAAYGLLAGILYEKFPKKIPYIYVSLVFAMTGGRIVWGIVKFVMSGFNSTEFPFSAFISGAVTTALPGIILHIILIPFIVIALQKAKLLPNK